MKKILTLAFLLANLHVHSQTHEIGVNPFSPIFKTVNASYFYNFNDSWSTGLSLGYKFSSPHDWFSHLVGYEVDLWKGPHVIPEIRHYSKPILKTNIRFMAAAHMKYFQRSNDDPETKRIYKLGYGGSLGFQKKFTDHFLVQFFAGASLFVKEVSNSDTFQGTLLPDGSIYYPQNSYEFSSLGIHSGFYLVWRL